MPFQQEALLNVMLFVDPHNITKIELAAEVLDRFGSGRLQVQGSSMLPSLRPGDEVELRSPSQQIEVGDVVAYRRADRLFVHRVVERNCRGELVTRGDTLPQADAPVSESELLGVVSSVRRRGKSVSFQNTFARRATASLFRSSQLCAALFLKIVNL